MQRRTTGSSLSPPLSCGGRSGEEGEHVGKMIGIPKYTCLSYRLWGAAFPYVHVEAAAAAAVNQIRCVLIPGKVIGQQLSLGLLCTVI